VEERGEHGQQGLRGIEVEEGKDAAETDGGDRTKGTQAHVALRMRLDDGNGGIGGGERGGRQRWVHVTE
jgi:hypothetical protein